MRHALPAILFAIMGLTACQREVSASPAGEPAPPPPPPPDQAWFHSQYRPGHPGLAYSHLVGLEMPAGAIENNFDHARDRCLNDPSFQCVVVKADYALARDMFSHARPHATLVVRLPHNRIDQYANSLTVGLPGDPPGAIHVIGQTMTADDLSQNLADTARDVAQYTAYRDRLQALLKRPDNDADALIKIAREFSTVQSQLDEAARTQSDLDQRLATESLTVTYATPDAASDDNPTPITDVWHRAGSIWRRSLADMIEFVIGATAWLPAVAGGLILARGGWHLFRGTWAWRRRRLSTTNH